MKVLVTGGAGFIGSHTVVELLAAGHSACIIDNFCNARREAVEAIRAVAGAPVPVHDVDVRDRERLALVFESERPDAVIHFAALKAVGESWSQARDYHDNNVGGLLSVLDCMAGAGVRDLVFSSSATVYGDANPSPIDESGALAPSNPYGRTKAICETILADVQAAGGIRAAVLRYFNPVGAHPAGQLGEEPAGVPNNLMPYICRVASGRLPYLRVFGDDYPTPDGTGVRDYLHVVDLAIAHERALVALADGGFVVNVGTGRGYSVLEMVAAFAQASGREIPYRVEQRRPGDIAVCFADTSLAATRLGWRAERDLGAMCRDAWRWEQTLGRTS